MAYVLEYSAFHYSRRRHLRNGRLGALAAVVLMAALAGLFFAKVSSEPSWRDLAPPENVVDPATGERLTFQDLADWAFDLADEWGSLRNDYERMMPYLGLQWVPAPVTNVLDVVGRRFSSNPIPSLVPVSFSVTNRLPRSWASKQADPLNTIFLRVEWRTNRALDDAEWARTCASVSNWLSDASFAAGTKPKMSGFAAIVEKQRREGDRISATYAFPGARRIPFSSELVSVVGRLERVSAALAAIKFGRSGTDELSLQALRTGINPGEFEHKNKKKPFGRSLDPCNWLESSFPAVENSSDFTDSSKIKPLATTYRAWSKAAESRLPWRNGPFRAIRKGEDFIGPGALYSFLAALPRTTAVKETRVKFDEKLLGLTNALPASFFSSPSLDRDRALAGAARHSTSNLLPVGIGFGVLPRKTRLSGELTVEFPTAAEPGGECLFIDGVRDESVRYVFSEWSYRFKPAEATVPVRDISEDFLSFVAGGYGYEPSAVSVLLSPEGSSVSSFEASGVVPLALEGRNPAEKKGGVSE